MSLNVKAKPSTVGPSTIPSPYYPQFPPEVHDSVKNEARLVRDGLNFLKTKIPGFIQLTLSANSNIDTDLTPDSPIILLLSQNAIGGFTPTFARNRDNSLKFLGTTAITWVTTANTYTSLLFWATATNKAYLISYLSGANLS